MHTLLTTEPPVCLLEACKRWDYRHAPRHLASIFLSQPVFSILTAIPQLVHSHGALSWRLPTNSRWFPVKDLKNSAAVSMFLPSSCSLIGYRLFPISNLLTLNCLSWWFTLPRGCKPSAFSNYLSKAHYIWLMFKKKKIQVCFPESQTAGSFARSREVPLARRKHLKDLSELRPLSSPCVWQQGKLHHGYIFHTPSSEQPLAVYRRSTNTTSLNPCGSPKRSAWRLCRFRMMKLSIRAWQLSRGCPGLLPCNRMVCVFFLSFFFFFCPSCRLFLFITP